MVGQEIVFYNVETGEAGVVDTGRVRLSRLRRRIFAWANAVKPIAHQRMIMVTLTYDAVHVWKQNHIRDFLGAVGGRGKRRGYLAEIGDGLLAYAWVAELQPHRETGECVHYHLLLIVQRGTDVPVPDKSGHWQWGMSRIETARNPFYVAKYSSKVNVEGKMFPRGLRTHSVFIRKGVLTDREMWLFRLSSRPEWLRDIVLKGCRVGELPKRHPGGCWRSWDSDEGATNEYVSPYISEFQLASLRNLGWLE